MPAWASLVWISALIKETTVAFTTQFARIGIYSCTEWDKGRTSKEKIHIHRDPSCNNLLLLFTTTHCNNSLLVSCRESEVLQIFLTECGKQFGIPLVLLYFALWLVQKTFDTLSQSDAKLTRMQTAARYKRFPEPKAVSLFTLRGVLSGFLYVSLCFDCLLWKLWFWLHDSQFESDL